MHGQDILVLVHGHRYPNRYGFLPNTAKPFGDLSLPQQYQHLLFDEAGFQHGFVKLEGKFFTEGVLGILDHLG